MIGPRAKIIFLTWFFSFAFAMLFLALVQNYVHAETSSQSISIVSKTCTADIQSGIGHEIVPTFWIVYPAPVFDFDSDDSYQKFLSDTHPFNDIWYVPRDLLPIDSNFTANNSKAFKLRAEAWIHFADMAWHFWNDFSGDKLYIVSAYRSKWLQDYLISKWCTLLRCAKSGSSEHQAWLAVDLKVISKSGKVYSLDANHPNIYFDRLKRRAAEFWFHNTYQRGVEIDGKIVEGRHWRYLWKELATILMDNNQTLAEYYFATINDERWTMNDDRIAVMNSRNSQ